MSEAFCGECKGDKMSIKVKLMNPKNKIISEPEVQNL